MDREDLFNFNKQLIDSLLEQFKEEVDIKLLLILIIKTLLII